MPAEAGNPHEIVTLERNIMKNSLLKLWAMWRRFRRTAPAPQATIRLPQYAVQFEVLTRRANPFAPWNERANWTADLVEWLRPARGPRLAYMLDWLDNHRDVRKVVQATLQKTLREATGPDLFCATGLPREPAFFSELSERVLGLMLPRAPAQADLSALFAMLAPQPADAEWLMSLDRATLSRLWRLAADDGIAHACLQQIDEALLYLVTMVISVGVSPAFRQRLQPAVPLQATPFMALRRELEKYLMAANPQDDNALRSVRMLIAVCQAQTDRIYAHLDEYGVSVGLVYHIERMRSQLTRMARLIDVRAAAGHEQGAEQAQALLADLIQAHHYRASVRGLIKRSFSLLARKMVERNADHGERYIARDRPEYRAMLKAAACGGAITVLTVLAKVALPSGGSARFFEGLLATSNYALSFLAISALGGVLATKQPAVTAPVLASKMGALETVDGLRDLLTEIALLLRSQASAVFGNLMAVVPLMLTVSLTCLMLSGAPMLAAGKAQSAVHDLSIWGVTPWFAALTGVLLWLASLMAGFADNWFALRRLREALAHQRRLVRALGAIRAGRLALWLERHVADIAGNLALAVLLGMTPVIAQFFGAPLDVRHVTLATGTLTAAAASLGWDVLRTPEFWLAVAGIATIGLLNVAVAFGCALTLALRAREVPARVRRLVFRAVWRRFAASPFSFLFPERLRSSPDQATAAKPVPAPSTDERPRKWRG
jgi:site-specific recombinase